MRLVSSEIIKKQIKILKETYPGATVELNYENPFQLLIATILSAQTTDVQVNKVTPKLFAKYKNAAQLASAKAEDVQKLISSIGFFRQKSKSIIGTAQMIQRDYDGRVPDDIKELIRLPGVARKTANVVLGNAFGKNQGVAVDTHVKRLSARLGLTDKEDPKNIEKDLMEKIPQKDWADFSNQLIWLGRRICVSRKPKCPTCPLKEVCPSADIFIKKYYSQ